jgi:Cellulose binding domain
MKSARVVRYRPEPFPNRSILLGQFHDRAFRERRELQPEFPGLLDDCPRHPQGGHGADDHGTAPIMGWTLAFDFAGSISSIWNANNVSHVGNHYVLQNANYNSLLSPAQAVSIGFNSTEAGAPINDTLNGVKIGEGRAREKRRRCLSSERNLQSSFRNCLTSPILTSPMDVRVEPEIGQAIKNTLRRSGAYFGRILQVLERADPKRQPRLWIINSCGNCRIVCHPVNCQPSEARGG